MISRSGQTISSSFFAAHILAGLCFLLIGAVTRGPHAAWWCVACLVVSSFLNGASSATSSQNPHDLSPNYVASLCSVLNAVATSSGFLAPMMIAWLAQNVSSATLAER